MQWLDTCLRSDSGCKYEMIQANLTLPSEAAPRALMMPSTWFGPKHKDKQSRIPFLTLYLQKLLTLDKCSRSPLLKIFLSPDELFRPVRKAVKHAWLASTEITLDKSLRKLTGSAGGDEHSRSERCDGKRLQSEQRCFEDLSTWVQLQCDKSLHGELSAKYSKQMVEVSDLISHCDQTLQRSGQEQQRAEKVRLSHEVCTAELEAMAMDLSIRIEYAGTLVQRQRETVEVLYQPNHSNDQAHSCGKDHFKMIMQAHHVVLQENTAALDFVAKAKSEISNGKIALLEVCGDNESVERCREFLTLGHPWKLTPSRRIDETFVSIHGEKAKLLDMLCLATGNARENLSNFDDTISDLNRVQPLLKSTSNRTLELGSLHVNIESQFLEEKYLQAEEARLRRAKLDQIDADVSFYEQRVPRIFESSSIRWKNQEVRLHQQSVNQSEHGSLRSEHERRRDARHQRIAGRLSRNSREDDKLKEQRSSSKLLFFDRQADEDERLRYESEHTTDENELHKDRKRVGQLIIAATSDNTYLEQSSTELQQERGELSAGNPRLGLEMEASGVASLPEGSTFPYTDEVDPEMATFSLRRVYVDQQLNRLSVLLNAEDADHQSQIEYVAMDLGGLTELHELYMSEDPRVAEEKTLIDYEISTKHTDDELLQNKIHSVEEPLKDRIREAHGLLSAVARFEAPRLNREQNLHTQLSELHERQLKRASEQVAHEQRKMRHKQRLSNEHDWTRRVDGHRGLPWIPKVEWKEAAAERERDANERSKSIHLLRQQDRHARQSECNSLASTSETRSVLQTIIRLCAESERNDFTAFHRSVDVKNRDGRVRNRINVEVERQFWSQVDGVRAQLSEISSQYTRHLQSEQKLHTALELALSEEQRVLTKEISKVSSTSEVIKCDRGWDQAEEVAVSATQHCVEERLRALSSELKATDSGLSQLFGSVHQIEKSYQQRAEGMKRQADELQQSTSSLDNQPTKVDKKINWYMAESEMCDDLTSRLTTGGSLDLKEHTMFTNKLAVLMKNTPEPINTAKFDKEVEKARSCTEDAQRQMSKSCDASVMCHRLQQEADEYFARFGRPESMFEQWKGTPIDASIDCSARNKLRDLATTLMRLLVSTQLLLDHEPSKWQEYLKNYQQYERRVGLLRTKCFHEEQPALNLFKQAHCQAEIALKERGRQLVREEQERQREEALLLSRRRQERQAQVNWDNEQERQREQALLLSRRRQEPLHTQRLQSQQEDTETTTDDETTTDVKPFSFSSDLGNSAAHIRGTLGQGLAIMMSKPERRRRLAEQ